MGTPESALENIEVQLAQLRDRLDYQEEIATLRTEVTLQRSHIRWAAWTAGAILAVLGFLGIKAWNDITESTQKVYQKQLLEVQERYSKLARGFSLVDSGRNKDAISYLTPIYEANHYDEPIVSSLLYALSEIQDCEEGPLRVKELRQDEARFLRIKDPSVFQIAGGILRDCFTADPAVLEQARMLFELSLKRWSAGDPDRRYSLYGLFTYYWIKGDVKQAEAYLREAVSIKGGRSLLESTEGEGWADNWRKLNRSKAGNLKMLFDKVAKSYTN